MAEEGQYKAESIKVLEGLEGVRRRPSMYIGSTSKDGLHHLVYEVVDNSIDECLAGFCTEVSVTINKDGSVTVRDNGRGIPVDNHPIYKKSAMEIALTKLHAGGKFEKQAYQISGGLHGVGVSVVNALSIKLISKVCRDGKIHQQEYKIGKPLYPVKIVGKCDKNQTGTEITFFPDKEIFSTLDFDSAVLRKRLQEIAFLNPVKIILKDEKRDKKEIFHHQGGLREFIEHINKSKGVLHKPIYFKKENDNSIEVVIQYTDSYNENIFGFVNTINTTEGGTHISGFKTALTRAINDYVTKKGMLKNEKISGDDTREGLTAVINLKMREPQFEGQTKTKLGNSDIKGIVDSMVYIALGEFLEENPSIAGKIGQKIVASAKARDAAKKARDLVRRKNVFGVSGLPGKLADCSSKKFEKTELFIVEGDSAGGCFSGDTEIALTDGRNLSFKDLVEEHKEGIDNFCYTIREDGTAGIERIKYPRITKKNVEVIKIVLDNDEEIICTPDHKFMLRDGNYKEAKDLTKEDSLMPLNRMLETIENYNHKIKKIVRLNERINVYDLEVEGTHNFALASGVFVHNSAKMAREKEYQAILPLKGKILNVEKSNPTKALSSEEIINLITAIGTGVKENFDLSKLRYGKVVIMSVDGEEGTFIQYPNGRISFVKIGEFIDNLIRDKIDPVQYKVLCFSLRTRKSQFKSIQAVLKHKIHEELYEIKTSYGRNVKITSSHSVFVFEDNEIKLKKGSEIKKGDKIVAPKNLPLHNYNLFSKVDVLSSLIKNREKIMENLYIKGGSVEELLKLKVKDFYRDDNEMVDKRIIIPEKFGEMLAKKRKNKKLSQKFLCSELEIKQPCIYYDWEKGKSKPSLKNFKKYVEILGVNKDKALAQVQVVKSKLDNAWDTQYKNSGRNIVKDYIKLSRLDEGDLRHLDNVVICPTHYATKGINRFVDINNSFVKLIGFWIAEGSCSSRNGIRLAIGNYNSMFLQEFNEAFSDVFGTEAKLSVFNTEQKSKPLPQGLKIPDTFNSYELKSSGSGQSQATDFLAQLPKAISSKITNSKIAFARSHRVPNKIQRLDDNRCSELKLVNRAAALFWQSLFGFSKYSANTKKIPDIIFNVSKELQLEFLRGYFLGDGTISKNGISFCTVSKDLANQIMYLLQSFGVVAGLNVRGPNSNDKVKSKQLVYTISITSREDLINLRRVWESHRNSDYLKKKLNSKYPSMNRKFKEISADLIALEVREVREVKASNEQVYDFSVDEDENFIAGMGGLCCHNTDADVDGQHIMTLLLTFFYRYMPELIENGNVYVAVSPLYRVRKKKDHYVYSDDELKKLIDKLGKADVQRFKGLGEMNPQQLWDTTMNPKSRILKRVTIEDAVMADETFSMLMGDVVGPRRRFIELNANIAEVDV